MSASMDFPGIEALQRVFANVKPSIVLEKLSAENSVATTGMSSTARNEMIAKLVTTCVGLAVSCGITFVGVKWLVEAMDPTRREKKEAHQRVNFNSTHM